MFPVTDDNPQLLMGRKAWEMDPREDSKAGPLTPSQPPPVEEHSRERGGGPEVFAFMSAS